MIETLAWHKKTHTLTYPYGVGQHAGTVGKARRHALLLTPPSRSPF